MTVSVRSLDNGYHVIRVTSLDQTLVWGAFHSIFKKKGQMEMVP